MSGEIFVVDDDAGHISLIEANLRDTGIVNPIVRFTNGYDAIDAIFENPDSQLPILMLLDLNMPGMHGTKVLNRIRSDERTRLLPVVILTTSSNSSDVEECYRLGCNFYLVKPVIYEVFVKVIRSLGNMIQIISLPNLANTPSRV